MKAVDLFCGCGGASIGMQQAGVEVVAAFDNDPIAMNTYSSNVGKHTYLRDLSEVDWHYDFDVDWVHGSPPCQGLTVMGNRDESDERNELTYTFLDWIEAIDPKFVTMENVRGILSLGTIMEDVVDRLESMGYYVNYELLNCANYGVPQIRKRVFLIARKDRRPQMPTPTHYKDGMGSLLGESKKPWRAAKSVLRNVEDGVMVSNQAKTIQLEGRSRIWSVDMPSYTISTTVHFVIPGVEAEDIVDAGTLDEFPQKRQFTVDEMADLQTFPKGFRPFGTLVEKRRQVGNAVPPLMQKRIAQTLME